MIIEKSKYIIESTLSIKEALIELDKLSGEVLTLFVLDENETMLGTLTDGDIRRSLIEGVSIDDNVLSIVKKDFAYLIEGEKNFNKFKTFKEKEIKLLPVLDSQKKIVKIYNLKKLKSFLPVDAVLMAGGKGERLRPLTEKIPKPLLKVGDKAIIDYNIDIMISHGIENISVTTNYLAEQIEEHFKTPFDSVKVNCVKENKFYGTMGAVKFVKEFHNDTVLVMNSDLLTNINLEDFYLHFKKNNADMSVAAVPYPVDIPYGIFDLDGRNIKKIVEKPTFNYYANAGIYLIKKEILDLIPKNEFFNATDLIELLVEKNKNIIRFPLLSYWLDIGKPIDFQKAQDFVKHF